MSLCASEDEENLIATIRPSDVEVTEVQRKSMIQKLRRRVLPLMVLLSFVSYLDRTNLAFVAEDMQASLILSDRDYSIGGEIAATREVQIYIHNKLHTILEEHAGAKQN